MIQAEMKDKRLGYVGKITNVDVKPICDLLEKDYIPVVSTIGCDKEGNVYNINADTAAAFIAGGHVLIEDVPGVGKTTLASALARLSGLDYTRMQFTPDVTPSDITGFNMFDKRTGEFVFRSGAVNTDIFLGDEINRASPKTQSALLEAMSEGNVTVDGEMHLLPKVFTVIATQNPMGFVGTYPLPEAQVDRFCMRFSMGYPSFEAEMRIAAGMTHENTLPTLNPVCTREEILEMRSQVKKTAVEEEVYKYAVTLVTATRENKYPWAHPPAEA